MNLSKKILSWYDNNKRTLPWRISKKSKKMQYYRILSEFMLQQTQVKTVIPYFNNFVKKVPNLKIFLVKDGINSLFFFKEYQLYFGGIFEENL